MPHSDDVLWYLYVDFQCMMTVPAILMLCFWSKKAGIALCGALITFSITYTIVVCFKHDISANPRAPVQWEFYYYAWPTRSCVYYVGCLMALLTTKTP